MKSWILLGLIFTTNVFASSKELLNERLNQHQSFSAEFTQKVISPDGELLLDAKGNANILRPNFFRWETTSPDENLIVSDGESVWYYDPFMSQVTIMKQKDAMNSTPFVLLTRNQPADWIKYEVTQEGDTFLLTNVGKSTDTFSITIDEKGVVKGFEVIEQDGQINQFTFSNPQYYNLGQSQFTFEVPDGVDVDDQR